MTAGRDGNVHFGDHRTGYTAHAGIGADHTASDTGGQADEFFGEPGSRCALSVARVARELILVADA